MWDLQHVCVLFHDFNTMLYANIMYNSLLSTTCVLVIFFQVYKTGITHYFSIEAARKDFGYLPEEKTLENVVKWFKDHGHGKNKNRHQSKLISPTLLLIVFLLVIFAVLINQCN